METETETIRNWTEELETVNEMGSKNWFKPESQVTYQVVFQDEGGPENKKEFDERTITQVDFKVKVTGGGSVGVDHTWTITKGGPDSLFGQLTKIFEGLGKSTGANVEVTAVGDGKSRRYLVRG